jgi:Mn2+/Fe2+ NRAMP family transporter
MAGLGDWRRYLAALGPGLVTGVADDDPSGIAVYAVCGASAGYGLIWTGLYTAPLLAAIQEVTDRTALTTGKGLGELMAGRLPVRLRWLGTVLLSALIVANTLNIAADLAAIGSGMGLLGAGSPTVWALLAGIGIWMLLMWGSFHLVARIFKTLALSLAAYLIVVIAVHPPFGTVALSSIFPTMSFTASNVRLLVAIMGTTISPYLIFWQSAHRVEELREGPNVRWRPEILGRLPAKKAILEERLSRTDVFAGAALSSVVMWSIMVATASTVGSRLGTINTAGQAAAALAPVAGRFASAIFALGFIASGVLAVPVLAGSGAAGLAGLFKKEWGYSRSPKKAPVFYGLVAIGTLGGTAITLLGSNVFQLLVVVGLINGLAATPFLIVLMLVSSDPSIMGEHRNHLTASILGWTTAAIMSAAGLYVAAQVFA